MSRQVAIDALISRLLQWGDDVWIGQMGIGDLSEHHSLAKDCKDAAEFLTCLTRDESNVTATEYLRRSKPIDIALGRLSWAMGNPAVHWHTGDSTVESALIDEATRRILSI